MKEIWYLGPGEWQTTLVLFISYCLIGGFIGSCDSARGEKKQVVLILKPH